MRGCGTVSSHPVASGQGEPRKGRQWPREAAGRSLLERGMVSSLRGGEAEAMGQGPCFLWLDGGHWGQERHGHGNRRVLRKTKDASPGMSLTPRATGSLDFRRHKECLGFGVEEGIQGRQENGSSSEARSVSCPYTGQDGPKGTRWVPHVVSADSVATIIS